MNYNPHEAAEYNQAKNIKAKECDCADCRKRISMNPDNCVGFGLYVCESCKKKRK